MQCGRLPLCCSRIWASSGHLLDASLEYVTSINESIFLGSTHGQQLLWIDSCFGWSRAGAETRIDENRPYTLSMYSMHTTNWLFNLRRRPHTLYLVIQWHTSLCVFIFKHTLDTHTHTLQFIIHLLAWWRHLSLIYEGSHRCWIRAPGADQRQDHDTLFLRVCVCVLGYASIRFLLGDFVCVWLWYEEEMS